MEDIMSTDILNEEKKAEQLAEGYRVKYAEQVEALEGSMLSKVENINEYHVTQLGKQLDAFETYHKLSEANGTLNNLGILPKISLDVITATMGQSILPVIASVQAIEAQKGIVHFKNVEAVQDKGNMSAQDIIIDPRKGTKTPEGYASNSFSEVVIPAASAAGNYTGTLQLLPSRSQFLYVSDGANVNGADQGVKGADRNIGTIWGNGIHGTINYKTGEYSLDLDAVAAADISISYQQNYEAAQDIPKIESYWDSKEIEAEVFALKSTIGMLQAFTLQKQYGESAMDEMAKDLIRAINMEIGGTLIRKIRGAAQGVEQFSRTAPTGVSFFEHKMTYMDSMYNADANMLGNAGRGQISVMMVGRGHAALVASLPGFKKLSDGRTLGAHVFGELNGVVYIRVPEDNLIGGPDKGYGLFKGSSPFESCAVYSPFMPLTVTSDLPEITNPLVSQRAAATMAGVNVLVDQYATELSVVA
jgi:hypothetical protein